MLKQTLSDLATALHLTVKADADIDAMTEKWRRILQNEPAGKMALLKFPGSGPFQSDSQFLKAARSMGADVPESDIADAFAKDLFYKADGLMRMECALKHYLIFVINTPNKAASLTPQVPLTFVVFDCDADGKVDTWDQWYMLTEREVQIGLAKLRFMLANDLLEYQFDHDFVSELKDPTAWLSGFCKPKSDAPTK